MHTDNSFGVCQGLLQRCCRSFKGSVIVRGRERSRKGWAQDSKQGSKVQGSSSVRWYSSLEQKPQRYFKKNSFPTMK